MTRKQVHIGIDMAKQELQLHGAGRTVTFRKMLTKAKVLNYLAAMEPCASER